MNKLFRDFELIKNIVLNFLSYKDNGLFVFGEWMGKRVDDNCLYLANYLCVNHPEIPIAWICDDCTDLRLLDKSIKVFKRDSKEGLLAIKNAKVLIMNQGLSDFSDSASFNVKKPLRVNLWHGVMWKKIGYDGLKDEGVLRNLEHKYQIFIKRSDLYIALSENYKLIMQKAFFIKKKSFINCGYPRNTVFYDRDFIIQQKKSIEKIFSINNPYIIVYLPTFRDACSNLFSFSNIDDTEFNSWLKANNVYILQKAHAAEKSTFDKGNEHIINISNLSAQELMAASDMLITDYSSCFFDYLILDHPIIHYLYDYRYYMEEDRGLYYKKEKVACGATPETLVELIDAIKENFYNPSKFHELRLRRKKKFLTYENSNSCEIIIQKILEELEKKEHGKGRR